MQPENQKGGGQQQNPADPGTPHYANPDSQPNGGQLSAAENTVAPAHPNTHIPVVPGSELTEESQSEAIKKAMAHWSGSYTYHAPANPNPLPNTSVPYEDEYKVTEPIQAGKIIAYGVMIVVVALAIILLADLKIHFIVF